MYLAKKVREGAVHYLIKESYKDGDVFKSRELFDLGEEPGHYIKYPGGYSFYIDETVELTIAERGIDIDTFELQELFWPFIEPRLKTILETFWMHHNGKSGKKRLSRLELAKLHERIHVFDKRRLYYCRYGTIDRVDVARTSYRFYNHLLNKSRDEIECFVDEQEGVLKSHEMKDYVFTIFNLQRFFPHNIMATRAPQALDQEKVEHHLLEQLCKLNHDSSFFFGEEMSEGLHEYLIKYLVMFFDSDYGYQSDFDDFMGDFFRRYQRHKPPEGISQTLPLSECFRLLGITETEYKDMTKDQLTRVFRKLAHKCHPDKGGEHDKFICICQAYEKLLDKKSEWDS